MDRQPGFQLRAVDFLVCVTSWTRVPHSAWCALISRSFRSFCEKPRGRLTFQIPQHVLKLRGRGAEWWGVQGVTQVVADSMPVCWEAWGSVAHTSHIGRPWIHPRTKPKRNHARKSRERGSCFEMRRARTMQYKWGDLLWKDIWVPMEAAQAKGWATPPHCHRTVGQRPWILARCASGCWGMPADHLSISCHCGEGGGSSGGSPRAGRPCARHWRESAGRVHLRAPPPAQ